MTGYIVHYSDGTTDGMKSVAASSTSTDITGSLTYTISVEATSQHLSGESEERTIGLGEWNTMNITLCTIYGVHTSFYRYRQYSLCLLSSYLYCTVPGQPSVSVASTTTTSISISWSVPSGSVSDSYEVMWQRDTSGECSDEDEGSTTITDGSTSYDIMGLEDEGSTTITDGSTSYDIMGIEEDSSYSITVTATNVAGSSAVSDAVTAMTLEAGER